MDEHIEPPTTIKEVGIHIGYMREDMTELKELVKALPNNFASKSELQAVEAKNKSLQEDITALKKFKDKLIGRIAYGAVLMFVLMGLGVYGLDKFLR